MRKRVTITTDCGAFESNSSYSYDEVVAVKVWLWEDVDTALCDLGYERKEQRDVLIERLKNNGAFRHMIQSFLEDCTDEEWWGIQNITEQHIFPTYMCG